MQAALRDGYEMVGMLDLDEPTPSTPKPSQPTSFATFGSSRSRSVELSPVLPRRRGGGRGGVGGGDGPWVDASLRLRFCAGLGMGVGMGRLATPPRQAAQPRAEYRHLEQPTAASSSSYSLYSTSSLSSSSSSC